MNMIMNRAKKYSIAKSNQRVAYMLLTPGVVYLVCVLLGPFCWAAYISFTDKMVGADPHFIGIGNYLELFRDKLFFTSVKNTLVFTIVSVFFKVVFGVIMALVLNSAIKARSFFRALLILPWTIPTVISALAWKWMLAGGAGGVLNHILMSAGLSDVKLMWLGDSFLAMLSVIMVNIWRGTPFVAISVLAGLQTLPGELSEAAAVDGANILQRFIHITLPGISSVVSLSTLVTTIWTLNEFSLIWLLTRGGPANTTHVISTYSYVVGFSNFDLGKALSVSVLTLPILFPLVNLFTKQTLQNE